MQTKRRGRLIMIDGINGVGKDEQATRLCDRAIVSGLSLNQVYVLDANPAIAKRWELLEQGSHKLESKVAQALEFYLFHQECVESVVLPMLSAGQNILMNRGPQTTLVYNVISRGLAKSNPELVQLAQRMLSQLCPDLSLIMDLDPEIAISRMKGQKRTDQFQEELEAYALRRADFLHFGADHNWKTVDVSGSIQEVNDLMWQNIEPILRHSV